MGLDHKDWRVLRPDQKPRESKVLPGLNRRAPCAFVLVGALAPLAGAIVYAAQPHHGHVQLFVSFAVCVAYWGLLTGLWPHRRRPKKHPTAIVGLSWLAYLFSRHFITSHLRMRGAPKEPPSNR